MRWLKAVVTFFDEWASGLLDHLHFFFRVIFRWKHLSEREKVLGRIAIGSLIIIGIAAVLLVMFGPEVYFYG